MQTVFIRLNIPGEPPTIISLDGLDSADFAGIDEGKLQQKMFECLIEALKSQTVQKGFISLISGSEMYYQYLSVIKKIKIKEIYSLVPVQHRETGQQMMAPVKIPGFVFSLSSLAGLIPLTEKSPLFGVILRQLREKESGLITPEVILPPGKK